MLICCCFAFYRVGLTRYEQSIGLERRQKRKKRTKSRGTHDVASPSTEENVNNTSALSGSSIPQSKSDNSVDNSPQTVATSHRNNCRGWFPANWSDASASASTKQSAISDPLVDLMQTITVVDGLSSARLVADQWSSLKEVQRGRTIPDLDWLRSSPAGVLWSGDVKPLVHPARATSNGTTTKLSSAGWLV